MAEKQNTPKIRFEGFTDPWEQRKLGDCFEFLKNNTLSRADLNGANGTARNVHYGDILIKFGDCLDGEQSDLPFITDDTVLPKFAESILREGDVIFADTAEDEAAGKCVELRKLPKEPTISGLHTIPARPRFPFGTGYLGHYLNSDAYHRQLLPLMQGIKVISVSKAALQDTQVRFPSLSEQSAIGVALSEIDNLITLHQRKYDKLCTVKKSMLDKMFPKPGETEPEIRFEGFTDPWEQRKLGDCVGSTYGGGTPSTSHDEYWGGNIPWIQSSNVLENELFRIDIPKAITQDGLSKSAALRVPGDSIAVVTHVGVGKLVYLPFPYATSQDFVSLSELKGDANFLCYAIHRKLQSELHMVQGSAIKGITKEELLGKAIFLPAAEEQKLVGNQMRAIDNLITLHQRKLELLRNIKKSQLDRMFV